MVSGEPLLVEKSVGDGVIGGTLNKASSFVMEAQRVGAETVLSRIYAMVNAIAVLIIANALRLRRGRL